MICREIRDARLSVIIRKIERQERQIDRGDFSKALGCNGKEYSPRGNTLLPQPTLWRVDGSKVWSF